MFWLLALGVGSVIYGLRGERDPGRFIKIMGTDSDNGLRPGERAFWIVSGVYEIALGFIQLHARYNVV